MRSKNQRVIAKRTSQIMKYGQDVIIQIWTDDVALGIFQAFGQYSYVVVEISEYTDSFFDR